MSIIFKGLVGIWCTLQWPRGAPPRARSVESARRLQRLAPWRAFRRAGVVSLLLAIPAIHAQAGVRIELAQARHDLAISEQVLERVAQRADTARADPATTPEQRQRLDEYLARVRDLVELNRERVRMLEQSADETPAASVAIGGGGIGTATAVTSAEEVAALDAKLSASLADFDQLLLEEARKAQARAPSRASAHSSGAGSSGGESGGASAGKGVQHESGEETGTADKTRSPEANKNPAPSGTGPGSPGGRIDGTDPGAPGATAAVPPDVGDGSDDDIVARQIRRAAEAETDPELRKKLWDEYRKYKEGTKG